MKIAIVLALFALFALIVHQLGAGLYYMITDKGGSSRMAQALSRRIGLSLLLVGLLLLGIATGVVEPHGMNG